MKNNILLLAPCPPGLGGIATWSKMIGDYSSEDKDNNLFFINVGSNKVNNMDRNIFQRIFYGLEDLFEVKKKVKNLIANNGIDLFHMTVTGSLSILRDRVLLNIARKNNIPVILHIRIGRVPEIKKKRSLEWALLKKNLKKASKIITIDQSTYYSLSDFGNKVTNITNPIDVNKYINCSKAHLQNGCITYVGWIIKEKGIEELLDSFNRIKVGRSLSLNLVGPYNVKYLNTLKEKYSFENVNVFGKQNNSDTLKIVADSELFVLPSYTEGCPNSVLEAMLCKTPIIASNVGAIPELLDGECGLIVNAQDKDDLLEKMTYLLNDVGLQNRLIENAYKKATTDFSLPCIYEKYKKIWDETVNKGR